LFRSRFPTSELSGQVQGVIPINKKSIYIGAEFLSLSAPPAFFILLSINFHVNSNFLKLLSKGNLDNSLFFYEDLRELLNKLGQHFKNAAFKEHGYVFFCLMPYN